LNQAESLRFGSLLTAPFDYCQAFDRALKEVVVTLPNRPAKERDDDTVGTSKLRGSAKMLRGK
jgi:hypothetical protein